MSLKSIRNQVLALAGVYQACQQVQSIAWHGRCDKTVLDTALASLFKLDAETIDDIYGGTGNLRPGLQRLSEELNPQAPQTDMELTRYVISLFNLQHKLKKKPDLLAQLREAIQRADTQREHYGTDHPNTWAALAGIYQNTISTLTPKIMINGERVHLANSDHAAKIRALLLAGVRSAVLWRQCGGSRLLFLFNRRNYFQEACDLLAA